MPPLFIASTAAEGRPIRAAWIIPDLTTMESRDKEDIVATLQLVRILALKLPIGVVDQAQDAGSPVMHTHRSALRIQLPR